MKPLKRSQPLLGTRTTLSPHLADTRDNGASLVGMKVRRVLHPARIFTFFLILLVLLTAAFWAGATVKGPNDEALNNAQRRLEVTYPVSLKVVDKQLALKGVVVRGQTTVVSPPTSGTSYRHVVTKPGPPVGTVVAPGSFLGAVGAQPVFLLPDNVPIYRDLDIGDSGDDVTQLQEALRTMGFNSVQVSGKLDAVSRDALNRIYSGDGLVPPGKPAFRVGDFAQIPGNRGVVAQSAGLATLITETTALITIQTTPDTVVARASVVDADVLSAGIKVRLSLGNESVESDVLSVGGFTDKPGPSGEGPGRDVTISVPFQGSAWLIPDKQITVQGVTPPQEKLAVPLIGIQHDGSGPFVEVLVPDSSGNSEKTIYQRVDIKVKAQDSGWAAVESVTPLTAGQQVRIP